MGLVTNRPAPLHPKILDRVLPQISPVLQLGQAVWQEHGLPAAWAPTCTPCGDVPPAWRGWSWPGDLAPPPEMPPRKCPHHCHAPRHLQPVAGLTGGTTKPQAHVLQIVRVRKKDTDTDLILEMNLFYSSLTQGKKKNNQGTE